MEAKADVHFTHLALVLPRPGLRLPAALGECSACPEPTLLEIHQLLSQKTVEMFVIYVLHQALSSAGEGLQERRIRGSLPSDLRG